MVPERRNSYLAGEIERDKARKLLGLKVVGAPRVARNKANRERKLRRAAGVVLPKPKPRVGKKLGAVEEIAEHVAREGKIPRGRESLMLTSQPADLVVARVPVIEPLEEEGMRKDRVFRRGDSVIVRIRHQGRAFTEHVGEIKDTEGATAVVSRGGITQRVRLADVRRNGPGTKYGEPAQSESGQEEEMLSAKIGESVVAKIKPPGHFESGNKSDQAGLFSVVLRQARQSREIPFHVMAKMLRIDPIELKGFEDQDDVPDDDVAQRLVELFDIELDPVLDALGRTKAKHAAAEAAAANEKAKQEAEKERVAAAARKKPVVAAASAQRRPLAVVGPVTPLVFEEFGELVMELCPLPLDAIRRKQWYTAARILFELQGLDGNAG